MAAVVQITAIQCVDETMRSSLFTALDCHYRIRCSPPRTGTSFMKYAACCYLRFGDRFSKARENFLRFS